MKKRLLALVLAGVMAISMVACGGNGKTDNSEQRAASKEGVFKITDIEQDFGVGKDDYLNINSMKLIDDTVYALVNTSFSNGNRTTYMTMDVSGAIQSQYVIQEQIYNYNEEAAVGARTTLDSAVALPVQTETTAEEDGNLEIYSYVSNYYITEDGRLAYVLTSDINNIETGEYISKNEFILCDVNGQEFVRTELKSENQDSFYVNCMIPSKENTFFAVGYDNIYEINLETGEFSSIEPSDMVKEIYSVAFYKDGMPVVTLWNDDFTKQTYNVVDIRKGTVVEELTLPDTFENFSIYDGRNSGYDMILVNNNAVYGYNMGDTDKTQIMNYVNSDLAAYRLRNIAFMNQDNFIAMYNDIVDYDSHIARFTKIPADQVPDKDVLTVATGNYIDNQLKQAVVDFNKTNEQYRITITDYSEYNVVGDYTAGATKLDNDIISGKVPDIIVCSDNLSIGQYADKGLLADFYELMDKDETIQREDYCENVFRALEYDGKLYQMPTNFRIATIFGKESIFGTETSISWDRLESILAQYPDSVTFSEVTKETILSQGLLYTYNQLVDEVTGECHFDSEAFKNLLEFANQFPDEINYDAYNDENYWQQMETQYVEDRALLCMTIVYSVYDAWLQGYRVFGEDVTPVGFPTEEGSGSCIQLNTSYAISKKSPYIDGAWEFIKSFISEEAQTLDAEEARYSEMPILKSALEKCAEQIKYKPYYTDMDGNKQEYDETVYIGGQEIVIEPASDEDVEKLMNFILSVDKKASGNYEEALKIITEDAAGYFSGAKSLDEVVGVIQSRMNILVSEDR